jgi:protein involved in ribonucleotide reduction
MKIIYFSLTGNVHRFVKKTDYDCIRGESDMIVGEDFILITYTFSFGEVPKEVERFLENNHEHLSGVIGSGNMNWGVLYCKAAHIISEKYNVAILQKFELAGNIHDVAKFNKIMGEI